VDRARQGAAELSARAKQTAQRTAKTISDGGNAAWREAKVSALEVRANPAAKGAELAAGTRRAATAAATAAATSTADAARATGRAAASAATSTAGAARATVDAARKTSYTAAAGAEKTREVSKKALDLTRTSKGKAVAIGTAAAAGTGLVVMGAPVVGGVVVAVAAKKGVNAAREVARQRRAVKQTELNEIIAARATARRLGTPRTSTTSEAAPITPRTNNLGR
jgi:hypothetical protein